MSRVFVLGTGPLPGAGARVTGAHGLRTWQLVKPLLDAGHTVDLFTLPVADPEAPGRHEAGLLDATHDGFAHRAFANADLAYAAHVLPGLMAAFRPDALLGVNVGPAALLALLPCVAGSPAGAPGAPPLWADLYGSATLEAQAKAARDATDAGLSHGWRMERAALLRADRVSAVSRRQADFAYGQLGALGRLNRFTFATELVHVVPASANPDFAAAGTGAGAAPAGLRDPAAGALAPEPALPAGAFAALWSGGYNAWTDFDGLLAALLSAMDRAPALHFVSTGGAVHGHCDLSYPRFREAALASPHAARFRFLGWIDAARVPGLTAGADLGLVADSPNVETRFGTRTRVVNMLAAGLPVLMTAGTELAGALSAPDAAGIGAVGTGAATVVPAGDMDALADALVRLAASPPSGTAREAARAWARRHAAPDTAAAPLLAWAANPEPAPDLGHPRPPGFDDPREGQPGRSRWKRVIREAVGPATYARWVETYHGWSG